MNIIRRLILPVIVISTPLMFGQSFTDASKPAPQPVPTIDGGAGSCTLELTVKTDDGKPAAAATVKVHIAYRFGGFHKLDLEAGTNSDGKVKFTGLPSRVRRSVLEFHATKDALSGTIQYDPSAECHSANLGGKLGKWNQEDFVRAVRTGVLPDGKQLSSAMPWTTYAEMNDTELEAMWLYLRGIPPSKAQK